MLDKIIQDLKEEVYSSVYPFENIEWARKDGQEVIKKHLEGICDRLSNHASGLDQIIDNINGNKLMYTITQLRVLQTRLERIITDINPRYFK